MYKRLCQFRAFGYLAPPEMRTHYGLLCQLALNRQRAKQKPLRAPFRRRSACSGVLKTGFDASLFQKMGIFWVLFGKSWREKFSSEKVVAGWWFCAIIV